MCFESFVDQLEIIKFIFCPLLLEWCKLPILYPFLMLQAYVACLWISYPKILWIRDKVSGQHFFQSNCEGLSQP